MLEENTGASFSRNKHRLTRLRRARDSQSPPEPSSSKRKQVVRSDEEDIDNDDLELPQVQDIHNIWDDERAAAGRDEDEDVDMDDMDNFIEYEDEEEPGDVLDEEAREERRRERRRLEKERRRAMGSRPELAGIDAGYVFHLVKPFISESVSSELGMKSTKSSVTDMITIGLWSTTMSL